MLTHYLRRGPRAALARSRLTASGLAVSVLLFSYGAAAQTTPTWVGGRSTPVLAELAAVDATGEAGWPYGSEDVGGDGAGFQQQEQSLDIRTAYAATDNASFWTRVYVSDPNNVGGNVTVYVFIDNDLNDATGCDAEDTALDPGLVGDPTLGGYEFVIALDGNGSFGGLYECQQNAFAAVVPPEADAVGEGGTDLDPINVGADTRAYVQVSLPLDSVGLTAACDARLFFRSVNQSAATTASDINVGEEAATCRPADVNNDGIPDAVVPPECQSDADCPTGGACVNGACVFGCTTNAGCPAGGVCIDRACVIAASCVADTDCAPDEECAPDGRCIVRPQGTCTTNADCGNDLACVSGDCVPCTTAGATCASGLACAPDGRCVTGTPGGAGGAGGAGAGGVGGGVGPGELLNQGEEVQGGACTCRALGGTEGRSRAEVASLVLLLGVSVFLRRSARRPS